MNRLKYILQSEINGWLIWFLKFYFNLVVYGELCGQNLLQIIYKWLRPHNIDINTMCCLCEAGVIFVNQSNISVNYHYQKLTLKSSISSKYVQLKFRIKFPLFGKNIHLRFCLLSSEEIKEGRYYGVVSNQFQLFIMGGIFKLAIVECCGCRIYGSRV